MYKAPYDEKNQADYLEMTGRIEAALSEISGNPALSATEVSLSKLVGCSRNTLRNRKYPLERLKEIKRKRAEKKLARPARITKAHYLTVDVHIERAKALEARLMQSREEIAIWVNKYFLLETENRRLKRHNELLLHGGKSLEVELESASINEFGGDDLNIR